MTDGVTKAWVDQQAAKALCPVQEGWQGGVLIVWVPGTPRNPLNGPHGHWSKHAKWAVQWRERANTHIYLANVGLGRVEWEPPWSATEPKRITFTVYGPSRFDDDNLRAVVKPCRDALKDMRVIDDDRDSSGHTFVYAQAKPTRSAGAIHGIAIRIELSEIVPAPVKG